MNFITEKLPVMRSFFFRKQKTDGSQPSVSYFEN